MKEYSFRKVYEGIYSTFIINFSTTVALKQVFFILEPYNNRGQLVPDWLNEEKSLVFILLMYL